MPQASSIYKGYTKEALNRQYDVDNSVPDLTVYQKKYNAETERVRGAYKHVRDVAYGSHPLELLDVFPAAQPGSPVHVYIHGGGWRTSSKNGRGFPAESFVNAGATYIPIDYPLAPDARMDEIVDAVRRAISWVWTHAAEHNGDPNRIYVSGNSAGGHLTAMLIAAGWQEKYGVPADVVKGATGISGLYDLEPHTIVDVRAYLNLDAEEARRNSPTHHLPDRTMPIVLAVGGDEPAEFLRQSRDYQSSLVGHGIHADLKILSGHNHFSIMAEMNRPEGELLRAMLAQMGLAVANTAKTRGG
ncbi:MAG: alpha/beta hydrolase [Aquisalimonadaceae bacterium]